MILYCGPQAPEGVGVGVGVRVIEGEICEELLDVSVIPTVNKEEMLDDDIPLPLSEGSGIVVVDDETLVVPPLGEKYFVDEEGSTKALLLICDVGTPLEVDDKAVELEIELKDGGFVEAILDEEVPVEEAEVGVATQC